MTDAIGAFLIGVVLGASTYRAKIERVAVPLRDVFAAFFFLNFGLALNIAEFGSVASLVAIAVAMTFVLSLASGMLLARLHSMGLPEGLNAAAVFVNRGEFTLILATLSVGAGLDERLRPFAGLYVLIMAVLGPLSAARSERLGAALRRARPQPARRKVPRDPLLAEEIALVEAATAEIGSGSDHGTQRAVKRVVEHVTGPDDAPDKPSERVADSMADFIADRFPEDTEQKPDTRERPGDYT